MILYMSNVFEQYANNVLVIVHIYTSYRDHSEFFSVIVTNYSAAGESQATHMFVSPVI
jgi:hypothetical protein